MAHKMPTTHVGCYRPAVLDGGSNPPISTSMQRPACWRAAFILRGPIEISTHIGRFLAITAALKRGAIHDWLRRTDPQRTALWLGMKPCRSSRR